MGERGNIAIVQEDGSKIYFYTHWSGYKVNEVVKEALAKKWRWDDPAYLARIVFDVLTKNDHDEETGFGISNTIQDNSYPIPVINTKDQTVTIDGKSVSFKDYTQKE